MHKRIDAGESELSLEEEIIRTELRLESEKKHEFKDSLQPCEESLMQRQKNLKRKDLLASGEAQYAAGKARLAGTSRF